MTRKAPTPYAIYAHKNGKDVMVIESNCNGGDIEATIEHLQSLGYTTIVITEKSPDVHYDNICPSTLGKM